MWLYEAWNRKRQNNVAAKLIGTGCCIDPPPWGLINYLWVRTKLSLF